MKGIVGRTKRYVTVVSQTDETGEVTPLTIVWEDGRRYGIDRVLDRRQAHSLKTGGTGIRYTVRVGGQATYLWYEGPRWFVEAKETVMPD
jgi:hypothetical protein